MKWSGMSWDQLMATPPEIVAEMADMIREENERAEQLANRNV